LGSVACVVVPVGVFERDAPERVLRRAAEAIRAGAAWIEWRVDEVAGTAPGHTAIEALLAAHPAPCIVTARSVDEGGTCRLGDGAFAQWLRQIGGLASPPRWIDVECARMNRSAEVREAAAHLRGLGVKVLCSFHDFAGRPVDLTARAAAMQQMPVDAVKLVWMARSIRDCLECRDLLASSALPMIALCMGQAGLLSRVMAGAWGALATFAAADSSAATAPGQTTVEALLGQWRFGSIDANTALTGLVGDPIGNSPGFVLHNRAYDAGDINAVYLPLPVAAGWEPLKASLATLIEDLDGRFRGASITIPHKLDALRFVRERGGEVSAIAEACGAVNTISVEHDGSLRADNTDVCGILEPLEAMGARTSGRAAVLGAGGVARAAVAALCARGADVHVFNRSRDRAEALVSAFTRSGATSQRRSIQLGDRDGGPFDLVVQATSVGMASSETAGLQAIEAVGLDVEALLEPKPAVLETIYDPVETPLVLAGREAGCQVATGVDMWLSQAAAQQEIWFGEEAAND
jgi:3-dehydroquinate dehydratase/shikimate dehydrogenase